MTANFPFMPLEDHYNGSISYDDIIILYYPLTGGRFLANSLSCSDSFIGQENYSILEDLYDNKETFDKTTEWYDVYDKNLHHNKFILSFARYFLFEEWIKFKNIIYIDFTFSKKELDFLNFRKDFIISSVTNNYAMADLQMKYQLELISFFKKNNKKYFSFGFDNFLNRKNFSIKINECLTWLNCKTVDSNRIEKIWNLWWKSNLKVKLAKENKI